MTDRMLARSPFRVPGKGQPADGAGAAKSSGGAVLKGWSEAFRGNVGSANSMEQHGHKAEEARGFKKGSAKLGAQQGKGMNPGS